MNILILILFSAFTFSQDFVFDKEKGRAVPSYVGQIKLMKGQVFKKNAEGTQEVELGERFKKEDIILTGDKSFAKILVIDDTLLSIGPSSEFKFDEVEFQDKSNRKLSFSLLKGQLTGNVKNKAKAGDIKFRTKYTSMGVRGTYFLMNHQTKGNLDIAEYALLTGKVEVSDSNQQMIELKKGDKVVLIHDSTKNISGKDSRLLSPDEFTHLNAVKVNEEEAFKPFLPYFTIEEAGPKSPLYPLIHTASLKAVKKEKIEKREDPKPHYEETLKELNNKLRENQKRR